MTKIEELKQMAEASNVPYYPRLAVWGKDNDAEFIKAANPQTILALLNLVEMQHEALERYRGQVDQYGQTSYIEPIKAFEEWNKP